MKHTILSCALLGLFLTCNAFSCGKDDEAQPGNGNPPAVTLPINCDFSTASRPGAAVQNVSGINFTYTVSRPGGILRNDDTWVECIPTGNDSFSIGGFWQGAVLHGALIADIRQLPAIHKVTVNVFNDIPNVGTQLRLCDASGVIAETAQNQQSGSFTLTVDVGGKKAAGLYIYGASTVVRSILIE